MRRFVIFFLVMLLFGTVVLVGCPRRQDQNGGTTTTTQEPTATTSTTSPRQSEIAVSLYFIEDRDGAMFLVPENRPVRRTPSIARAALEALIDGPKQPGRTSVIPRDTEIRSLTVRDGLATVDFSADVLDANVGAEAEELGIYQIVNTLTEFRSIQRVRFLVEGKDSGTANGREIQDWWGHVGLADQPFRRRTSLIQGGRVQATNIRVEQPRAFSSIANPVNVRGTVRVFEATFQVRILDKNDTKLAEQLITATDFNFGSFNESIRYTAPAEAGRGTVYFFYYSAKDGSEVELVRVPVFLSR